MNYEFVEKDLEVKGKCESCEREADHVLVLIDKKMVGFFRSVMTVRSWLISGVRITGSSQRNMQSLETTNVPRCVTPENKVEVVLESIKEIRKKMGK